MARKKTNIGPCREEGCEKTSLTRGYCYLHYGRLQKAGAFRTSGIASDSVFGVSGSEGGLEPVLFAPGLAHGIIVIDGSGACGCAAGTETVGR